MSEITSMTVRELSEALAAGDISSVDITRSYLDSIKKSDDKVGGYITVTEEEALAAAKAADDVRTAGNGGVLTGIPAAIKDNICTKGVRTTCASKMLGNFVPPYDATVMEKLNAHTVPVLGKVNMDEFAMGSSTENSAVKITHNPRSIDRVPGGSSGGSAAVVAANEAPFSLGSDTGGSIRQPAAFCGVVGMKPTYGRVSRYGLVAFASSLDQIGPVTKTVEDNALVLNAIAGYDKHDATSVNIEVPDYTAELKKGVKGMKIALLRESFGEGISGEVKSAVMNAAHVYEGLGAEIVELSMPSLDHALPAYYVISSAEASSNLARFDGVRYGYRSDNYNDITELYLSSRSEGFGAEVKRRIMLGTFALSSGYYDAYYKKALQVRTLIMNDYKKIFEGCDLILSPVAPTVAYKIGEKTTNPLEMYLGDICTVPMNIGGVPALSLPCGEDSEGLPIGMQLIGPAFSETTLYRAGAAFEAEQGAYHIERGAF
ncbi:MAG: Asp-tRNA(Asn)/Glu-tRNA(Gln) amidotransferase subunit GatA [Oscillospiraceae bacterium]|nr:Asp-tRNA(Asn)/Glu-tRNA(Gln) amidotransferase subunit GatA [Oscillospiraceae bacterium]